jgi:hypothetical protein
VGAAVVAAGAQLANMINAIATIPMRGNTFVVCIVGSP